MAAPDAAATADAAIDVCIAGGGIGGLAVALALQRKGVRCRVYERDAEFDDRRRGYGLTLSHLQALTELGVAGACRAADAASEAHWLFRADGRVLGYVTALVLLLLLLLLLLATCCCY